jgi:hypothetical protein
VAAGSETWILSARDAEPGRPPRALWIRHAPGAGELACTVFDPAAGAPATVRGPASGPAGAAAQAFRGEVRARGRMAEWRLTPSGAATPLELARHRLRTTLEAPLPDGTVSGTVVLDGVALDVVGWRATALRATRPAPGTWAWLHAAHFDDEPDAWLHLALARSRLGAWVARGAVSLRGRRLALGGPVRALTTRAALAPGRLDATVPGEGLTARIAVRADPAHVAEDGAVHHAGLAEVRVALRRRGRAPVELRSALGGALQTAR